MATAVTGLRHGVEGQVVITTSQDFAAFCVNVHAWELDVPSDYFEADVFGDGGGGAVNAKGHAFYRGMYAWNGSFEGYTQGIAIGVGHDPASLGADPSRTGYSATLNLIERTSLNMTSAQSSAAGTPVASSIIYRGNALINLRLRVNRQTGLNMYTATFRGTGNLTEVVTA